MHWKKKIHAKKFDEIFNLKFKCICNKNQRIVYSSDNGYLPAFHRKSYTTFHVNIKHEDMKNKNNNNSIHNDESDTNDFNVGMTFEY